MSGEQISMHRRTLLGAAMAAPLASVPAWAATKREVDDRIDGALGAAGIKL